MTRVRLLLVSFVVLSFGCATTMFKKDPMVDVVKSLVEVLKAQQLPPTPTPTPTPALCLATDNITVVPCKDIR